MKVLEVITSLRTGGAEKLMVDLVPRLKDRGIDTDLLVFDGVDTPFMKLAKERGIKVYNLGVGGSVYSPLRLIKLLPFLRQYDIVHTHNTSPQFFAAIGKQGNKTKFITTEHNTSNRRRKYKIFQLFDRWMYNRYSNVICISKKAEENLIDFIGNSKAEICTINNGVDISRIAEAKASEELERIAPGRRKIVMVAAFRWEKDQKTLIKALLRLPEKFHLFLVGDGDKRAEIEELITNSGLKDRVHLLGIRSDVPELLHAADYVVMSSHFEGLSLSSVEGLSVGKPFIASDVDGLREVVKGAGVLFPHEDDKALAEEILKLEASEHYYNQVAQACYKRAQDYDISKMVDAYADVYRRMMEK